MISVIGRVHEMRISVDKDDPGYNPQVAAGCFVFLNEVSRYY